jgi:site-specific DNA recombinase
VKLVIPGSDDETDARRDGKLVALLARANSVRDRILGGQSLAAIAATEGSSPSRIGRLARLGLLAPDIIAAAVEGRQPRALTRSCLWEATSVPLDWAGQRRKFGLSGASASTQHRA